MKEQSLVIRRYSLLAFAVFFFIGSLLWLPSAILLQADRFVQVFIFFLAVTVIMAVLPRIKLVPL